MMRFDAVSELLEEYVPPFEEDGGDWEEIRRRADADSARPRTAFASRIAAAGAVAAAVVVAILLWPADQQPGVLDRALAAVGDGPVLHVVFEDRFSHTVIDLATGERRQVHSQREAWFDPKRGLHEISRFGGVVQSEIFYTPRELSGFAAKTFALLAEKYPNALQSGRARNLGSGEAYGEPVYWIRVDAELLPDSADGKLHEWAHDVAISRDTFAPVATRETRDGVPGPDTGARILRLERLAAGEGDFTGRDASGGLAVREGIEPITRAEANDALGGTTLWLGPEFAGLPLNRVFRTTRAEGRHRRTELFGRAAADALACRDAIRGSLDGRFVPDCEAMRRARRSLEVRGERVFELGPVVWGEPHTGVRLDYGTSGDRIVTLTETTDPRGLRVGFVPREGLLAVIGDRSGLIRVDGVYLSINASSEELLLNAARALEPMPTR